MVERKELSDKTLRDPVKMAIAAAFLAMAGHGPASLKLFDVASKTSPHADDEIAK